MFKEECIVVLALCCLLFSVPVFYLVNVYRMANFVHPSDFLLNFIKSMPLLLLAAVLVYGAYDVAKLMENGKSKVATRLAIVLVVLLLVAITVAIMTLNIGIQYVL